MKSEHLSVSTAHAKAAQDAYRAWPREEAARSPS